MLNGFVCQSRLGITSQVTASPVRVKMQPEHVKAMKPLLEVGNSNNVCLSCRGAGIGGLGITVEGPSESKISCKDNKDGSCSAEYVPYVPGDYDVNITYGGEHIPGKGSCSVAFTRGEVLS